MIIVDPDLNYYYKVVWEIQTLQILTFKTRENLKLFVNFYLHVLFKFSFVHFFNLTLQFIKLFFIVLFL